MRKISLSILTALAFTTLLVSSCEKDDEDSIEAKTITIDASAYGKWAYFSFEKNTVVNISDFSKSMDWDIAFHRMDVRVNCGKSGPGKGGTYDTGKTDYLDVTEAPEQGYSLNDSIKTLTNIKNMAQGYDAIVPADTLMSKKWLKFKHTATGPSYKMTNKIFVIRTAKGKYAKIWLKKYMNADSKGGHITMQYHYQPDGSRKLE